MLRFTVALCALLCVSSVSGQNVFCQTKCCAAANGGPAAPPECGSKCAGIKCGVGSFPFPGMNCPNPRLCCEDRPPLGCKRICAVIKPSCECTADDCCKSPSIRPSCREFCSTVDCAPPAPPLCPDTRLCCLKEIPLPCKETCKFVKQDCRCIPANCCQLPPNCDAGICAAVTCPATPLRPISPVDFPPIPSPTDNGGCNTSNCCPPGNLPEGCDASICAAVTCAAPGSGPFPPVPSPTDDGGCNISNCCPPRSLPAGCDGFICAAVSCAALPAPPVPSPTDNGGCNTSNCCPPGSLPEGCDASICAAVTCAAPGSGPFPPVPSPTDNGGCNTSNCCPPRSLPAGCDAFICAAVSCVIPPPPGCDVKSCCTKHNPKRCQDFCKPVDCSKECCSPTLSEEVDPDDVGCRLC